MSDDLVKRLRKNVMCGDAVIEEAADRIEKLEKNVEDWQRMYREAVIQKEMIFRHQYDRIEKLEAALRGIIGALDDPKGGQHVYDMRNASYIARKALEGKDD